MTSFKSIAYQILKKANKPLHVSKITQIALKRGLLKTSGKTPAATMSAQLVVDVNKKKQKSRFIKTAPSTFAINPKYKEPKKEPKQLKPAKLISEEFVKHSIIKWLSRNGWGRNLEFGDKREKGVDIKVLNNRYAVYFLIEAKGESKLRQGQEVAFVYSLGQIITRMNVRKAKYKYGLGLPSSAAKIALRRIPWQVAQKLNLYIFSVTADGGVKQYYWKDLKDNQKRKSVSK